MHIWKTERPIIDHLMRHTIATDRLLPIQDRERAMITIAHLVRSKQISQWQHRSGLRYWTLFAPRPLSEVSLVKALGLTLFLLETTKRSALTSDDIREYFPQLFRHGLPYGYFVEQNERCTGLGYAKVDVCSRVSRIVERSLWSIDKHRSHRQFRKLIDEGRFTLTWIVATDAKRRRLTDAFRLATASGVSIRVCAIRELLDIVAPIPNPR
tara:strand:- start:35857 stop:36489 length:633 start_codon:yes stop_codon:yes gene_type:complete